MNWNDYFMEFAKTASLRSNCIRANVGAVVVDMDNRILATGYNGSPSGVVSCKEKEYCYRVANGVLSGTRYETCNSIHAENNAIIQVGRKLCKGSSIYIYGHDFVCDMCRRVIINSGICDIYIKKDENSKIKYQSVESYISYFNGAV